MHLSSHLVDVANFDFRPVAGGPLLLPDGAPLRPQLPPLVSPPLPSPLLQLPRAQVHGMVVA